MTKKTLGWNPTYFGEPKKGSLASVVADITNKQNAMVGDKPEVQDSVVVQAEKAKQEAANPAQQAAIAVNMKKQGKKPKNEDPSHSMVIRSNKKKDAKGETPIEVHGEDLNKEIENAKMAKVKSLVDTIKDMFYTPEAVKKEDPSHSMVIRSNKKKDDKEQDEEGNAFGKAVMAAKEKGEKEFVFSGKKYNVEAEMDKVNPVAVKKKFKDRKDKDIDNDGDVDSSDKYLHKRRKAISKEID